MEPINPRVNVLDGEKASNPLILVADGSNPSISAAHKSSKKEKESTHFNEYITEIEKNNRTSCPTLGRSTESSVTSMADILHNVDGVDLLSQSQQETKVSLPDNLFETEETIKAQLAHKRWRFRSMDSFESEDISDPEEQRFVTKGGCVQIHYVNTGLNEKVFKDIFHTIMEAKWRYFMLLFTLSFLISWLIFASIWYIMVCLRNKTRCVDNVDSFVTAFLFSIETQVTIGYGGRSVTADCPEGVILLIIQVMIGTFINCALLGVLFAKLGHPKNRGKTIVFSKHAVITLRDGKYCLVYQYTDLRERKLLDSNMRLMIIRPKLTKEGEFVPLDMMDMTLTIDYQQVEYTMRLFPLYPISLIHIIDEDSPLYKMTKETLENDEFEIISILEGTVPGTGSTTKAITSFKPAEILWGHRFQPVYIDMRHEQTNCIDLSTFDDTYEENITPVYSAEEYERKKEIVSSQHSSQQLTCDIPIKSTLNSSIH